MQQMAKFEDSGLSPSFSCYTSDSLTSMAVTKVIHKEEQAAARFEEVEGEEFEFSLTSTEEEVYVNEIDSPGWTVFSRDLILKWADHKIDRDSKSKAKLFFNEQEESSSSFSCSSSEDDELENLPSGTFCVWRPKANIISSPKWKKSSSTGSGSKNWIGIRYLLRRSNSEGKDPIGLLTPKQKRNSSEVSKVIPSRLKAHSPVHEQFYLQKRVENEIVKRKTFLPYRQDLFGLFANVNGIGKMLPF